MSLAPPSSPSPKVLIVAEKVIEEPAEPAVLILGPSSEVVEEKVVDVAVAAPPLVKVTNQCGSCNKKVGVIGFKCRLLGLGFQQHQLGFLLKCLSSLTKLIMRECDSTAGKAI